MLAILRCACVARSRDGWEDDRAARGKYDSTCERWLCHARRVLCLASDGLADV